VFSWLSSSDEVPEASALCELRGARAAVSYRPNCRQWPVAPGSREVFPGLYELV